MFHFQIIGSTSTLDGAVAACLLKFGDKEGNELLSHKHMMTVCAQFHMNTFL